MVVNTNTLGGEAAGKSHARSEVSGQILALRVRGLASPEKSCPSRYSATACVRCHEDLAEIAGRPFICQPDASVTITEGTAGN